MISISANIIIYERLRKRHVTRAHAYLFHSLANNSLKQRYALLIYRHGLTIFIVFRKYPNARKCLAGDIIDIILLKQFQ